MKNGSEIYSKLMPTLNNMGYMFEDLTEYGDEFIRFSQDAKDPVLDIAAAYGIATLKLLQQQIKVVANDLDPRHLEILNNRVPLEQKHLLTLTPGRFPEELSFRENQFHSILISNMLHFLNGETIENGMLQVFNWLKPGGKVFIIAASPYVQMWHEFIPIFEENRRLKGKWPGFINNFHLFKTNNRLDQLPDFFHFFHPDDLAQFLNDLGFIVEKSGFIAQPTWPDDMQLDGRESVGVIARKPH